MVKGRNLCEKQYKCSGKGDFILIFERKFIQSWDEGGVVHPGCLFVCRDYLFPLFPCVRLASGNKDPAFPLLLPFMGELSVLTENRAAIVRSLGKRPVIEEKACPYCAKVWRPGRAAARLIGILIGLGEKEGARPHIGQALLFYLPRLPGKRLFGHPDCFTDDRNICPVAGIK